MVKAIYKNGVLKPLEKLDLKEGEEVEIEIKENIVEKLRGIAKAKDSKKIDEAIELVENEMIR